MCLYFLDIWNDGVIVNRTKLHFAIFKIYQTGPIISVSKTPKYLSALFCYMLYPHSVHQKNVIQKEFSLCINEQTFTTCSKQSIQIILTNNSVKITNECPNSINNWKVQIMKTTFINMQFPILHSHKQLTNRPKTNITPLQVGPP